VADLLASGDFRREVAGHTHSTSMWSCGRGGSSETSSIHRQQGLVGSTKRAPGRAVATGIRGGVVAIVQGGNFSAAIGLRTSREGSRRARGTAVYILV
jgi:hypothetical protein